MHLKICPHELPRTKCEICMAEKMHKYYLAKLKGKRKKWIPPPDYKKPRFEINNLSIIRKYLVHYDKNNIITKYVLLNSKPN